MSDQSRTEKSHPSTIELSDRRTLGYYDRGRRHDPAIFFFHGSGAAADGLDLSTTIEAAGGRLVSAARPGIGLSDPAPGRDLSSWADDVAELADRLEIDSFAVLGISGGGPYAAAVAERLAGRVNAVALLSCGGPLDIEGAGDGLAIQNRLTWLLAAKAPRVLRWLLGRQARKFEADPARLVAATIDMLQGSDAETMATLSAERRHRFFAEPMAEVFANGSAGFADDLRLLSRPWSFDPARIAAPVALWHGRQDTSAPPAIAEYLATAIPGSEVNIVDGGHLSVVLDHLDDAVGWLLARSAEG